MQPDSDVLDLEDAIYDDTLTALSERQWRAEMERLGRDAAEIEIDFEERGPLWRYAQSRRQEAAEALRLMVTIDPRDAVAIVQAQATISEYLRLVAHVRRTAEAAAEAERQIQERFNAD